MVTVFFGTNRNLVGTEAAPDFGESFNVDGPAAIRFGFAEVPPSCFDNDDRLADIKIQVAPESIDVSREDVVLGSKAVFEQVQHKMRKHSRDTVCFLHGYANSFRNALRHAAWLKVTYKGAPFNIFLFSWPSNGEMIPYMSYYSDRTDAEVSGLSIARTILKLRDFLRGNVPEDRCQQRLHLMAHSMGNFALRHAVQGIRRVIGDDPPRLFDNVFLFAADEDDDAFEHDHKLRLLPRMARLVNVYFNPEDRALLISDLTKRNPDRLGSDGPRLVDNLPRKVVLLDCREVQRTDDRDSNGHDYHRYSRRVIQDIQEVLKGVPAEEVAGREYMDAPRSYRIRRTVRRRTT